MESDAPLWVKALANLMMFGVPLLFLTFGIWMLLKTRRFMANAQRISATVVELGEETNHDDGHISVHYIPVYEYRSMSGQKVRARAFRSTSERPEIGQQQTMLIDPTEPEVVRFSSLAGYGFAAFGIGIGAPALCAVLFLM